MLELVVPREIRGGKRELSNYFLLLFRGVQRKWRSVHVYKPFITNLRSVTLLKKNDIPRHFHMILLSNL